MNLKSRLAVKPRPRGSTDPRPERTRKVVLEAAIALVLERGYGGCTVEAIVERTGVARTTIYRHWPSRTELLADALSAKAEQVQLPDTGTLRGDLIEFLTASSHRLEENPLYHSLQTIPGLIEAAKREPALVSVAARSTAALISTIRSILQKAKARREIRRDCKLDVMANVIVGAIYVQRAFLNKDLTDAYVTDMVDIVIDSVRPTK
jgi:AcrR family transcriptional regulator